MAEEKKEDLSQKVDYKLVAKNYAVGYGSQWVATAILLVPCVIIYVIAYFVLIRSGIYFNLPGNSRTIIVMVIIFAPLVVAGIAHQYLRMYLYNKWQK